MRPRRARTVSIVAAAVALLGCNSGADGSSNANGVDGARFVTFDGALLDGDLDRVGSLTLEEGMSVASVSSDARLLLSTTRDATSDWDCCGPDMVTMYVASADGSGELQLLVPRRAGQADASPDWSPDGEQVVFVRREAPVYEPEAVDGQVRYGGEGIDPGVYVVDADGSDLRRVRAGRFSSVRWSPTDDVVAAVADDVEEIVDEVVVLDVHDGDVIDRFDTVNSAIAWSPDGSRLGHAVADPENDDPENGVSMRTAIAVYDRADGQVQHVVDTTTGTSLPVVWGSGGLLARLSTSGGGYLVVRIDSAADAPTVVERCPRERQPCPLPVHAFD